MKSTLKTLCFTAGFLCATSAQAFLPVYIGVGAGVSRLTPDTENSGYTLDEENAFGGGVVLGVDLSRRFSAELGFHMLGAAELSNDNGATEIGYNATSIGGLLYLFGDASDIAERTGLNGYIRLGVNNMQNEHTIPLERADNTAIWAGAGVEWGFSKNFGLRGEVSTFDGDAQFASISLLFRPGSRSGGAGRPRQPVYEAPKAVEPERPEVELLPQQPTSTPPALPAPSAPTITPQAIPQAPAQPQPRVQTPVLSCEPPAPSEPADARGCALFSGVLAGVDFDFRSANLSTSSAAALNALVLKLQQHASTVIEIAAHTEAFSSPAEAKQIARQRSIAIARYLTQNGISVSRLRARAFGNVQPRAAETTPAGRAQNNRIELRVLR